MEIRENLRTVPSRPIAVVLAVLAVLALALTGFYVLGTPTKRDSSPFVQAPRSNHLPLNCTNDPVSPHDPICTPYHDPNSARDPMS